MKLYRGDSLPPNVVQAPARARGRTFANHFCGNGLMAKFADGGSSWLLRGRDLLGLTLAHVGYDLGTPEQELHDHSPLISFSVGVETAFRFSDRTQRKDLAPSNLDEASHFMWQLDVELSRPLEPGRYALRFQSDPVNCEAIVEEQLHRGLQTQATTGDMDLIGQALMDAAAMEYARADETEHYAELIDVVPFVVAKSPRDGSNRLVENTVARATRDREWLLYPMDPMHDGPGYSARFPMNKHLSVSGCFKIRGRA
jgi:hypothetical protein